MSEPLLYRLAGTHRLRVKGKTQCCQRCIAAQARVYEVLRELVGREFTTLVGNSSQRAF